MMRFLPRSTELIWAAALLIIASPAVMVATLWARDALGTVPRTGTFPSGNLSAGEHPHFQPGIADYVWVIGGGTVLLLILAAVLLWRGRRGTGFVLTVGAVALAGMLCVSAYDVLSQANSCLVLQ